MSMLILNVDDYEHALYAKTRLLRNAGFDVVEAGNGQDAISMAAALLPALMLLDVRMPDIDGIEVCRRIKSDPATSLIRVVHISAAFITAGDIAKGLSSGASDYVVAPYEPGDLIAVVRRHAGWIQ